MHTEFLKFYTHHVPLTQPPYLSPNRSILLTLIIRLYYATMEACVNEVGVGSGPSDISDLAKCLVLDQEEHNHDCSPQNLLMMDRFIQLHNLRILATYNWLTYCHMEMKLLCKKAKHNEFLHDLCTSLGHWLRDLEPQIAPTTQDSQMGIITDSARSTVFRYPFDGQLVQRLVCEREMDYAERIRQAEYGNGSSGKMGLEHPKEPDPINDEDIAKMLTQMPRWHARINLWRWRLENIGLRYWSRKFKGLVRGSRISPKQPRYFGPGTGLRRATILRCDSGLREKYLTDAFLALAMLPPEYCTFIHKYSQQTPRGLHAILGYYLPDRFINDSATLLIRSREILVDVFDRGVNNQANQASAPSLTWLSSIPSRLRLISLKACFY